MAPGAPGSQRAVCLKKYELTSKVNADMNRDSGLTILVKYAQAVAISVAMKKLPAPSWHSCAVIFIRFAVGLIFFTQGTLKYIDPHMGVLRFARIGFPYPDFTAHFVGGFEIVCGFLVLLGLFTRLAGIPLLIVILTAIATTKIPELFRPQQGFWFMVSDARTDFAMTMGLLFLIAVGAGSLSLDAWLAGTGGNDRAKLSPGEGAETRP
jgi:putative oxidoreductase